MHKANFLIRVAFQLAVSEFDECYIGLTMGWPSRLSLSLLPPIQKLFIQDKSHNSHARKRERE